MTTYLLFMLNVQEEFQLAIFNNKKRDNLFANRVCYFRIIYYSVEHLTLVSVNFQFTIVVN